MTQQFTPPSDGTDQITIDESALVALSHPFDYDAIDQVDIDLEVKACASVVSDLLELHLGAEPAEIVVETEDITFTFHEAMTVDYFNHSPPQSMPTVEIDITARDMDRVHHS